MLEFWNAEMLHEMRLTPVNWKRVHGAGVKRAISQFDFACLGHPAALIML